MNLISLVIAEGFKGKGVMADNSQGSSSQSYWEGYKEFWSERFSFLENYSKFIKRDKPIPSWSSSDVEEFIASDPVHGPVVMFLSIYHLHLRPLVFHVRCLVMLNVYIVFCVARSLPKVSVIFIYI